MAYTCVKIPLKIFYKKPKKRFLYFYNPHLRSPMKDKYAINKAVIKEINKSGLELKEIRNKTGLKMAYFGKLMNYDTPYGRPMSDEIAIKILLACDFRLSEAHTFLSEVRVADAIKNLPESDKKTVINNIVGNNGMTIGDVSGDLNITKK